MKKKIVSTVLSVCMLFHLCLPLVSCGINPSQGSIPISDYDLAAAPDGAIREVDGVKTLLSGDYVLRFPHTQEGYAVEVVPTEGDTATFRKDRAAQVKVRGKGTGIGIQTFAETQYESAYSAVLTTDYGYCFAALVETDAGSVFKVEDAYYIAAAGVFGMMRTVSVEKAESADVGFASIYSLENAEDVSDYAAFDYFIPSILYKDTASMVRGAIGSNLALDEFSVKETRTGMPMAMVRNKSTGDALALAHLQPAIDVGGLVGGGADGAVNDALRYGAVGISMKPVSAEFIYPCTEGPTTYDSGAATARRYHSVTEGNADGFRLGIVAARAQKYTDAMTDCYVRVYEAQNISVPDADIEDVYEKNIDVFKSEYREYKYGSTTVAAGFPFALDLPDAEVTESVSFQMGFVGQQLPAAYQLLRYGYENGNLSCVKKGTTIADMWSDAKIQSGYFPHVWWTPANNSSGGMAHSYPCFLRCMVDGMEGLLDAYRICTAYGAEHADWKSAVVKFGNNLVAVQNEDGSFYRAYNVNGTVCTDDSDPRYQGTSTLNTPIAVRFLAKMYEFTGEQKYYTAAVKAAEYCYSALYQGLEKYVGGTPDNPNTVDKEASVYALYAFNSAYMLTKDEKYLAAAQHAAISVMSWTYAYDFKVPNQSKDEKINPFKNGGVMGFSFIAVGHSSADNYSAYAYYEMYKLYLLTGNDLYKNCALLLQNATKSSGDYDGRVGYQYAALCPEATKVADFTFSSTGTWLPWSGVANLEPISQFEETFGVKDIRQLNSDISAQRDALNDYGCGGKAIIK